MGPGTGQGRFRFRWLFDQSRSHVYRRAQNLTSGPYDTGNVIDATFSGFLRNPRILSLVCSSILPWPHLTTVNPAHNDRGAPG